MHSGSRDDRGRDRMENDRNRPMSGDSHDDRGGGRNRDRGRRGSSGSSTTTTTDKNNGWTGPDAVWSAPRADRSSEPPAHETMAAGRGRGRNRTTPAWMTNTSPRSFPTAPQTMAPELGVDPMPSYEYGGVHEAEAMAAQQPQWAGMAAGEAATGMMPGSLGRAASASRDPRLLQHPIDLSSSVVFEDRAAAGPTPLMHSHPNTAQAPQQQLLPPPAARGPARAAIPDDGSQLPPAATKQAKKHFIAAHSRKEWNDLPSHAQRQHILAFMQQQQPSNTQGMGATSAQPTTVTQPATSPRQITTAAPPTSRSPLQLEKEAIATSGQLILLQVVTKNSKHDLGWMEIKRMDPHWGAEWQFRISDQLLVRSGAYKKVKKSFFDGKPYSILSAVGETALRRFPKFAMNMLPDLSTQDASKVTVVSIEAEEGGNFYLRREDDNESAKLYHVYTDTW
jgi:hypothetical protein